MARQTAVGVALGQQLGPAPPELLEQVAQAHDLLAVGRAHAAAQQPPQGVVEVAAGQQVVGQAGQQVVGVEVGELLRAVPAPVVVAGGHFRLR